MSSTKSNLKRKASIVESEARDLAHSDDEFGEGLLEGVLEDESDDDDFTDDEEGEDDGEKMSLLMRESQGPICKVAR